MQGVSNREAGRLTGLHESRIRELKAADRFKVFDDGSIDAACLGEFKKPPKAKRENKYSSKAKVEVAALEARLEYQHARTAKMMGELIDRAAAERAVFKLAARFRDQFRSFCTRVVSAGAAENGGEVAGWRRFLDRECRLELARMADEALVFDGLSDDLAPLDDDDGEPVGAGPEAAAADNGQ